MDWHGMTCVGAREWRKGCTASSITAVCNNMNGWRAGREHVILIYCYYKTIPISDLGAVGSHASLTREGPLEVQTAAGARQRWYIRTLDTLKRR